MKDASSKQMTFLNMIRVSITLHGREEPILAYVGRSMDDTESGEMTRLAQAFRARWGPLRHEAWNNEFAKHSSKRRLVERTYKRRRATRKFWRALNQTTFTKTSNCQGGPENSVWPTSSLKMTSSN
uniref:Transposase n=1 Tax=Haemonchus placei TaxID=6290 RepID=A0A0N4VT22_HAEPC